jgi:hypothetical protein
MFLNEMSNLLVRLSSGASNRGASLIFIVPETALASSVLPAWPAVSGGNDVPLGQRGDHAAGMTVTRVE